MAAFAPATTANSCANGNGNEGEGGEAKSLPSTSTSKSSSDSNEKGNEVEVEKDSKSRLENEVHPLDNNEVMERVFQYCSVEDLKACRTVGKPMWVEESLKFWRARACLLIHQENDPNMTSGITVDCLKQIFKEIEESSEDAHLLKWKPFQRYCIEGFKRINTTHSGMKFVVDKFGPDITHLTLSNCNFHNVKQFMDLILKKLPNLEEVKLKGEVTFTSLSKRGVTLEEYPTDNPKIRSWIMENTVKLMNPVRFPWDLVFTKLVNLEELQVRMEHELSPDELQELCKSLVNVRRRNKMKLNLNSLEVYPKNSKKIVFCHHDKFVDVIDLIPAVLPNPLPLDKFVATSFYLNHIKQYMTKVKFLRLLFSQAEKSKIRSTPSRESEREEELDDVDKYVMPNLTEFHAIGSVADAFRNLEMCYMPNLKKFVIESTSPPQDYSHPLPPQQPHGIGLPPLPPPPQMCNHLHLTSTIITKSFDHLVTLECDHLSCVLAPEEIRTLAQIMPNMESLTLAINKKSFPEVCKGWSKLKSLTVIEPERIAYEDMLDDEAITGFKGNYPRLEPPPEEERGPNVTDLTEVTEFIFKCNSRDPQLTERSAYHGFLGMQKLRSLDASFQELSEACRTALGRRIWSLKVRVYNNPPQYYYPRL